MDDVVEFVMERGGCKEGMLWENKDVPHVTLRELPEKGGTRRGYRLRAKVGVDANPID